MGPLGGAACGDPFVLGASLLRFVEPLVLSETVPCARGELLQFKEASDEASYLGACCGLVSVKAGTECGAA